MQGFLDLVNSFDSWFLQALQSSLTPLLVPIALAITFFGNPVPWMLLAIAIYWHGKENDSFYFMNVALFSSLLVGALKLAVARPRPNPETFKVFAGDIYTQLSFPSGHSALVAAYWAYLRKFLDKFQSALLLALVALVALSRVFLGVHFLSDVLAGIVLGVLIGKWSLWLKEKVKHKHFHPSKLLESLAIVSILIFALLALSFLESMPLAAIFLGFYVGFFLCKEIGLKAEKQSFRESMVKTIVGYVGIAAILVALPLITSVPLPSQEYGATRTFLLFGLVGFWASFLFPWIWGIAKNRKK